VARRVKVDLFEQIRREYEFGVGTIKGVARRLVGGPEPSTHTSVCVFR
jgi:hypothetical protein